MEVFLPPRYFNAYHRVDKEISIIQTINTQKVTYCMHRLPFGMKTVFNLFQDQILRNLPKTLKYFDDIIIHRITKEVCWKKI